MKYRLYRTTLTENDPWVGFHRHIYKNINCTLEAKEAMIDLFSNIPDYEGENLPANRRKYLPPTDWANFLRKVNPNTCGKMGLNLLVLREEISLRWAAKARPASCMTHLVNALRQTGRLTIDWPEMDRFIHLHMHPLFRGELPTSTDQMSSRFFLAAGASAQALGNMKRLHNSGRRCPNIFRKKKRGCNEDRPGAWELRPDNLTQILRDYFHEKETWRWTVYRMDAELQSQAKTKSPQSYIDDHGVIRFLEELEKALPAVIERINFDYFSLTLVYDKLFERLDIALAREYANGRKCMTQAHACAKNPNCQCKPGHGCFTIVTNLLEEMFEHDWTKAHCKKGTPPEPNPLTDIVVEVWNEYGVDYEAIRHKKCLCRDPECED
jgi:hypothetical protein